MQVICKIVSNWRNTPKTQEKETRWPWEDQELESKQAELFGLNVPNQSWQEEIKAAESYWLSSPAIQRCVSSYLSARAGTETEPLLGEKALKTLRLNQDVRMKLLEDFKRLPRSAEP